MNLQRLRTTHLAGWLALVLLVCQGLTQLHASQHRWDLAEAQASCEICVYAQAVGVWPGAVQLSALALVEAKPLVAALPRAVPELWIARPRSRAPPHLS